MCGASCGMRPAKKGLIDSSTSTNGDDEVTSVPSIMREALRQTNIEIERRRL